MPVVGAHSARRRHRPGSFGFVSEPDVTSAAASEDDARRYTQRIQAEIAADAERRRREDPLLARTEREIERAWAHVAPPGAVGPAEELLLDRIDRLSMVDVDAPLGSRPGIRQVKGAIRKGTYWYLRYMSDQLNALHNVQARVLRRMDDRLTRIESAVGLDRALDDLVAAAPSPGPQVGAVVAPGLKDVAGPVLVASCGPGGCVAALIAGGIAAYGVESDPGLVLDGIDDGLDLRVVDPAEHLAGLEEGSLGGVVIGGSLQRRTVSGMLEVVAAAVAACGPGGVIVIAPETVSDRTSVEAELLAGRGVSAGTWAHVLQGHGATTELLTVADAGIDAAVVARLS
jgi:hypothetical protein